MIEDNSTKPLRLFVAITAPDAVRNEMVLIQHKLRSLAPQGVVRWTRPEQFHLTFRFLGDVSSDCVSDLQKTVSEACAEAPALLLRVQGVGFFPHARSPRVIWIGVNDDNNLLTTLQKKIESAVRPFTKERAGERYSGHVTLGRFKQSGRLEIGELTSYVETVKDRIFGEWTAQEVEIIQSKLLPTGPHYEVLARVALSSKVEPS